MAYPTVKCIKLASIVFIATVLSACSEPKTAQEFSNEAQQLVNNKKYQQAIIYLKKAIRLEPEEFKSRIALGKLYLKIGSYLNAEKEFGKATELGAEFNEVSSMLAQIYSRQNYKNKSYDLVNKGTSLSDQEYTTLLLYAGITAINYNDKGRANDYLEQALVFKENLAQVKLVKAYYNYSLKKYDLGLDAVNALKKQSEFYIESVLVQGHLFFAKGDYVKAVEKFKEYNTEVPQDFQVLLFITNSLMLNRSFDEADKYIDVYLAGGMVSDTGYFYKSKLEYSKGNFVQSQNLAEKAIQVNDGLISARAVAGLSAFHLEKYEQSYVHLKVLEKYLPPTNPIKKIFALTKLKLGKMDEPDDFSAMELNENQLIANASYELIKLGDFKEAANLLNKIGDLDGSTSEELLEMGYLKLSIADKKGFSYLEKAVEEDPTSQEARKVLSMAYYKTGKIEQALAAVKQWQMDFPENINTYNLMAKIHIEKKNFKAAEAQLYKSMEIEPGNIYAHLYFANKDNNNNMLVDALRRVNSILTDSPDNVFALSLLFEIAVKQNNTVDALSIIEEAYLNNKSNHAFKFFFAGILFRNNNYDKCIEILNSWEVEKVILPRGYFVFLVGSYSNLKQYNEALKVNSIWLEQFPKDNIAWMSKLNTLGKLNDLPQALSTVETMISEFPNMPKLKILLPYYQILNKQFALAKVNMAKLDESQFEQSFVQGLNGILLFSEAKYENALPKLKQQYEALPSYRNARFVYVSLQKLNQKSEAMSFVETHLMKFPDDIVTKGLYAQSLLDVDLKKAQKIYQELLDSYPSNIVFLNNISWVEYSLNNFTTALKYAKKANELSPNQASILDTLAMAYFKVGKIEQAKMASSEAISLAPEDEELSQNFKLINAND